MFLSRIQTGKLPDNFPWEEIHNWTFLDFPHFCNEVSVVLSYIVFFVVIQVHFWRLVHFWILLVKEIQEINEELLGILLFVSLHDLDILLDFFLEVGVIFCILSRL